MFDTLPHLFMQRAFLVGAIAAVPFGLIGTFVVVRRIGYLAGAIAHCAFGGIGMGLYLQYILAGTLVASLFPPLGVAVVVAVLAALLVGMIRIKAGEREDTVIGAIWAVGMAVGLLLFNMTPGSASIESFLFGDMLLISQTDVYLISILSVVVLILVLFFFRRLEAVCFDEEFTRLRGIHTAIYFQLLLVLSALTVVLLVPMVGIIQVIAMLTLPPATACRCASRLFPICLWAILIGALVTWLGLLVCIATDLPAGPPIVLVAAVFYLASFFLPAQKTV